MSNSDFFNGLGTPEICFTGLTHAKRSNSCLKATFKLLYPPATGVVKGPFSAILYFLIFSNVSLGKNVLYFCFAFSPA